MTKFLVTTTEIKKIEWTLGNGMDVCATVEHITSKNINLDGHNNTVKVDEIKIDLSIPGLGVNERDVYVTRNVTDKVRKSGVYATVRTTKGIIGLRKETIEQIDKAIAAFAPKKKEEIPEPQRGFGWCEKCQSYCYGDCEA
jgi:hypothetical protein